MRSALRKAAKSRPRAAPSLAAFDKRVKLVEAGFGVWSARPHSGGGRTKEVRPARANLGVRSGPGDTENEVPRSVASASALLALTGPQLISCYSRPPKYHAVLARSIPWNSDAGRTPTLRLIAARIPTMMSCSICGQPEDLSRPLIGGRCDTCIRRELKAQKRWPPWKYFARSGLAIFCGVLLACSGLLAPLSLANADFSNSWRIVAGWVLFALAGLALLMAVVLVIAGIIRLADGQLVGNATGRSMRFTLRDGLWLTALVLVTIVLVIVLIAWWLDHIRLTRLIHEMLH